MRLALALFVGVCFWHPVSEALAKDLNTESIHFNNAPEWLTESMLRSCVARVENLLEWDVRKIQAYAYTDEKTYADVHRFGFYAAAFFRKTDSSIHISPKVTKSNFDRIFGHEVVHAIFYQKYKGAIPSWLEEGLANYIGHTESPDYRWLKSQTHTDITKLSHPSFDATGSKFHYAASTALIEMIASKCSLKDLLQLSVGAKMETYLGTYCEIQDLNASFWKWLDTKDGKAAPVGTSDAPWWKKPREPQWWEKKK